LLLAVGGAFGLYYYYKDELPSVELLRDVELQTPMRIYTKDGKLISQYGVKRRVPVSLDEVPETLVQAIIATEDSRFYEHFGVDIIGVGRAVLNLVVTGEKGQGASTLTMQLARGFFGLTRKKEYSRKVKEVFIAIKMEQELSKDEILELYLNKVELGHRAFGVGAAAQVYYGKSLMELDLAEIATIAGLPQRPSVLNPISGPEASKDRRRIVLLRMLDEQYITREQFDEAANAPVISKKHGAEVDMSAPYMADLAYNEIIAIYGKEIAETSGFNVFTTAISSHQVAAQKAVVRNLHDYDERHGYRGPLATIWTPLDTQALTEQGFTLPLSKDDIDVIQQTNGPFVPPELAELENILQETEVIDTLTPAVVMSIEEQSMTVLTLEYGEIFVDWDGLDWARAFITDRKQGPDPEFASDIVKPGMLIYVRQRPEDSVWQLSQFPAVTGAFVSVDPFTGGVTSLVGGYNFFHSQFNRATQAKRQIGSNVKPFIYASAIDNGYTLASVINDAPINQWNASSGVAWRPQNSPPLYDGPIRMRVALGKSKNVVSVRLLRGAGLSATRDYLTRFGFQRNEIPLDETMSLGSGGHTPLEVATGIAVLANGGFGINPYFIERIENNAGEIIWQAEPLYACDPCDGFNPDGSINVLEARPEPATGFENTILAEMISARAANSTSDDTAENSTDTNLELPSNDDASVMRSAPRVISAQTAFLVSEMMRTAVRANGRNDDYWLGTGWRATNILRRSDIGGKTGTTNDSRDTWFSGFVSGLAATSWVGFDDNARELGRASRNQNLINKNPKRFNYIGNALIGGEDGAKTASPAWIRFMDDAFKDVPELPKKIPMNIVRVRIDKATGLLTRKTDTSSMFEYFKKGTQPTTYAIQDSFELPSEEGEKPEPLFDELF
jgi:penicillin-binding protein 1A